MEKTCENTIELNRKVQAGKMTINNLNTLKEKAERDLEVTKENFSIKFTNLEKDLLKKSENLAKIETELEQVRYENANLKENTKSGKSTEMHILEKEVADLRCENAHLKDQSEKFENLIKVSLGKFF